MDKYGDQIQKQNKDVKDNKVIKDLKKKMMKEIAEIDLSEKPKKPLSVYFRYR